MGYFDSFMNRVLDAAREGKLGKADVEKLRRLFQGVKKRNTILAKGILTALNSGKASRNDIDRLAKVLQSANERMADDKKPFTAADEKDIKRIFESAGLSQKAARWFSLQVDEFLSTEIGEGVRGVKTIEYPAERKVVRFELKKQKLGG